MPDIQFRIDEAGKNEPDEPADPEQTCDATVSRRVHINTYAFEAGSINSGCTHGGGKHPSLDNATSSEDGMNGLALAFISYPIGVTWKYALA